MRKALVTGGCGFIGSHLVDRLVKEDVHITVIDNCSTGRVKNLEHQSSYPHLTIITKDLNDPSLDLSALVSSVDTVYHLAALADIVPSIQNPSAYYYANVQEVSVECYDPPPMAKKSGSKTYKYTDYAGTNNTVEISNDVVILGSLMGTGEEPGEAPKSGDPEPTGDVAMVPGGNPGGGNRAEATSNAAVGPQATDGASAGSVDAAGNSRQFYQGDITASVGSSLESTLGGSILAVALAMVGLAAL